MDKEKFNGKELNEKELEQVSGGIHYDQPKGLYGSGNNAVNPSDSCYCGTCGECSDYCYGYCTYGRG